MNMSFVYVIPFIVNTKSEMDFFMSEKNEFRVIVAGSRSFSDYRLLCDQLDRILVRRMKSHKICIVSGGAKGADLLGEKYASDRGMKITVYKADWKKHGSSAGPRRNLLMAKNADALVAFWDGLSRGTKSMVEIADKRCLPCCLYTWNGSEWNCQYKTGHNLP